MNRYKRVFSLPLMALSVLFTSVFLFGATASAQGLIEVRPLSVNEQIILQHSQIVDQKSITLYNTSQDVETLTQKKQELATKLATEQELIKELKQKIADKKAAEAVVIAPVYTARATVTSGGVVAGCGDNSYANFIYMKESGCNTGARNAGGCLGIGQACPGSKLLAACPSLDYACQNAFFTNYANRYGGWAGSYQFWLANGWW